MIERDLKDPGSIIVSGGLCCYSRAQVLLAILAE